MRNPPYFEGMTMTPRPVTDVTGARCLALLGDSVTTDHISPAGDIAKTSPAAKYLVSQGVQPIDFNSYGARRGNHEVMMRGTFANIRLRNLLAPGTEGGVTVHVPTGEQMSIFDAAMRYKQDGTPLVILAGKEYGTGSSRDWAAKGTMLLGVRAVIAESFERIHRSNLIGMGVLPLMFPAGKGAASLGLTGNEVFEITGLEQRRSQDREGGGHAAEGLADHVRGARAHRHAEGARLLPPRRHPAVRAAAARRQGGVDGAVPALPAESSKMDRRTLLVRAAAFTATLTSGAIAAPREPVIGGPCEGCEWVFDDQPDTLRSHARIAPANEPGVPMVIEGTVTTLRGAPARSVVVYAYHTDQTGIYPPAANRHGSLRGWAITDAEGRYRFDTIRPGAYPSRNVAEHVHMHVIEPGIGTYFIAEPRVRGRSAEFHSHSREPWWQWIRVAGAPGRHLAGASRHRPRPQYSRLSTALDLHLIAVGGLPNRPTNARRMRSGSPKPQLRAISCTDAPPLSICARAVSARRRITALAGLVPVSA